MHEYTKQNKERIALLFSASTGQTLPMREVYAKKARRNALLSLILVLVLSVSAYAVKRFSALDGDDLRLCAVYEGGGQVKVYIENRSDKTLALENTCRLYRFAGGEEIRLDADRLRVSCSPIPARGCGEMEIDLSGACSVETLEAPIRDWYYFVLTNHAFLFGQDFTASINFSAPTVLHAESKPDVQYIPDEAILSSLSEEAREYLADIELSIEARLSANSKYAESVEEMIAQSGKTVVRANSPLLLLADPDPAAVFDESFTQDAQRTLTGLHYQNQDWNFKLLATQFEEAQVLSVYLPLEGGDESALRGLPVRYYFTYRRAEAADEACAFVNGRLISFAELAPYKVYGDDDYVIYELHDLIYSNLWTHTQQWLSCNPDIRFDDALWKRIENVCAYFDHRPEFVYH